MVTNNYTTLVILLEHHDNIMSTLTGYVLLTNSVIIIYL